MHGGLIQLIASGSQDVWTHSTTFNNQIHSTPRSRPKRINNWGKVQMKKYIENNFNKLITDKKYIIASFKNFPLIINLSTIDKQTFIQSLNSIIIRKKSFTELPTVNNQITNTICPITMETIVHSYIKCHTCKKCFDGIEINKWLVIHDSCPMCRASMTSTTLVANDFYSYIKRNDQGNYSRFSSRICS